jgi:hypothetical protein
MGAGPYSITSILLGPSMDHGFTEVLGTESAEFRQLVEIAV